MPKPISESYQPNELTVIAAIADQVMLQPNLITDGSNVPPQNVPLEKPSRAELKEREKRLAKETIVQFLKVSGPLLSLIENQLPDTNFYGIHNPRGHEMVEAMVLAHVKTLLMRRSEQINMSLARALTLYYLYVKGIFSEADIGVVSTVVGGGNY